MSYISKHVDVSIIIVSYNTVEKTRVCIQTVINHTTNVNYEIIVSDNGSTDGSVEMIKKEFPNVLLLENNFNLGFGKANNIALKYATGKYVLFLNSDAYLLNNAVKLFFDYWENNDDGRLGAVGAILRDKNNNIIHSSALFPSYNRICKRQFIVALVSWVKSILSLFDIKISRKTKRNLKERAISSANDAVEVDYITGADLFVRNNDMARFNPEYFMYCEETELELKLATRGLKRVIINTPLIIHDQNEKTDKLRRYSLTDAFKDLSYMIYSINNLRGNIYLLRFLFSIVEINPYARKRIQTAKILSKQSITKYEEIIRSIKC